MLKKISRFMFFPVVVSLAAVACAHEVAPVTAPSGGVDTVATTGVSPGTEQAVEKVAKSRCRRAGECNRIGPSQMYADTNDCMSRERDAARQFAASCANGVEHERVNKCIGMLDNQHCDADLGPVTAMPECKAYCAGG